MSDLIMLEIKESVATLTLNNPQKRNALTKPAWQQLKTMVDDLSAKDALRCLVIRGQGRDAFAAGADISEFPTERANGDQAEAYGKIVEETIHALETCRHPIVAMIYGACTGGGLEIACACDLRLAGQSARFGVPINRLGHTLAYPQLSEIMALCGPAVLSELLLEGQVMDADYALRTGLVNRVVPDDALEEAVNLCVARIKKGAPLAARLHKKMIRNLKRNIPLNTEDLKEPYGVCDSQDYQNGFRSFLKKEKPTFEAK